MTSAAGHPEEGPSRIGKRYVAEGDHPPLRPRDAASLILIDRSGPRPLVLVGQRGRKHVFMPEVFVFPGGRRDPSDLRTRHAAPLRQPVLTKLSLRTPRGFSEKRAGGLGVAAIRETLEEVGIAIGSTEGGGGLAPDLSHLRYVARAITPPRQVRRYDTRFFACFLDEIGASPQDARASDELANLAWIGFDDAGAHPLPGITRSVLSELQREMRHDPDLPFGRPVPFFHVKSGIFVREML